MTSSKIKVKFFGMFRSFTSREERDIEIDDGTTISKLVQILAFSYNQKLGNALIDPLLKDARPNALILINNTEINLLKGLETELQDGDIVTILPVTHGG